MGNEIRIPVNSGLCGACINQNQIVNVPDAYNDNRFDNSSDEKTGYRTKSVLCIPIRNGNGRPNGVI